MNTMSLTHSDENTPGSRPTVTMCHSLVLSKTSPESDLNIHGARQMQKSRTHGQSSAQSTCLHATVLLA